MLYALELLHGILAKAMYRLGRCDAQDDADDAQDDAVHGGPAAPSAYAGGVSADELEMARVALDVDEAANSGEVIVRNHARHFIATLRQQGEEPDFVAWIHKLHPENCKPEFTATEGIDPRIHATGSNFRRIWAEALALQHEGLDGEAAAHLQVSRITPESLLSIFLSILLSIFLSILLSILLSIFPWSTSPEYLPSALPESSVAEPPLC